MSGYPGNRASRALNNHQKKNQNQKKAWADQEDAFFGSTPINATTNTNKSSSSSAKSASNSFIKSTRNLIANNNRSQQSNKDTSRHGSGSGRNGFNNKDDRNDRKLPPSDKAQETISHGVRNLKRISATTGTKISGFLSTAATQIKNQRDLGDSQSQNQRHSSEQVPLTASTTVTVAKRGNESSRSSFPKHNFSFNTSKESTENVSRNVRNVLLSQVPMRCLHCHSIPMMYQTHPFFGGAQRICSTHPIESVIRCASCFRWEPKTKPYQRIGTSSALVCDVCARTAILDDNAATLIYMDVLSFLESLGLDMYDGKMKRIPIRLESEKTMSDKTVVAGGGVLEHQRGVCMWSEQLFAIPNVVGALTDTFRRRRTNGKQNDNDGDEDKIRRNHMAGIRHVKVNFILCLKGLPRTVMASVIAHEAIHAWLGLNPIRRDGVAGEGLSMLGSIRRIDQTCEEGVCQLASHLYLQHIMSLHDAAPRKDGTRSGIFKSLGQGPSGKKMIRYYKWSIENHPSPVYGGGFKLA
eukprot:CAMPEP_0194119208 /NCGR_PEP_ID=MMETSP0150-20130528/38405_1 /TAXON_ID=122233 /ORGANISM="Chaetoceros debilis, Strain MM31A-1" /LENGTH=523 /DNA_ID=CAMNT_0038810831 /DNA_START=93 /DNA_END=1661 /DNA_ORIENTATION=+